MLLNANDNKKRREKIGSCKGASLEARKDFDSEKKGKAKNGKKGQEKKGGEANIERFDFCQRVAGRPEKKEAGRPRDGAMDDKVLCAGKITRKNATRKERSLCVHNGQHSTSSRLIHHLSVK